MTVIAISRTEIDRMSVLQDLAQQDQGDRRRVADEGSSASGVPAGKAYAQRGPGALVSRKRGRPSNRAYPADLRDVAIGIIRERYPDFGPTLAAEKLAELHDIHLARETVRQWMLTAGLWKDRRARLKAVHQPRYRRDCLGELIQIDGSEHWWFEGRGPRCTLLVYIDDATSRLMHLQFVESESTFDYFAATRAYLERYGKPVAFYSDKHGVFRVNRKDAFGGGGSGPVASHLHAAEHQDSSSCANSTQAKFLSTCARNCCTLQMVGEGMRLSRHRSDCGRQFVSCKRSCQKYSARLLTKTPFDDRGVQPALWSSGMTISSDAFAWKEERTISVN